MVIRTPKCVRALESAPELFTLPPKMRWRIDIEKVECARKRIAQHSGVNRVSQPINSYITLRKHFGK